MGKNKSAEKLESPDEDDSMETMFTEILKDDDMMNLIRWTLQDREPNEIIEKFLGMDKKGGRND